MPISTDRYVKLKHMQLHSMAHSENLNFLKSVVEEIPGFLAPFAAITTMDLLDMQQENGVTGPTFEIGVYGGKYLSVLARGAAATGDRTVGLDPFLHYTPDQVKMNLASINGVDLHFIHSLSGNVSAEDLQAVLLQRPRFIDIDGSHERDDVIYDLRMCEQIIHPQGIVAVDDWYNVHDAGVAEAFYRFFADGLKALVPFAYTANKLLMSSRAMAPAYKERIEKFVTTDTEFPTSRTFQERSKVNRRMVETNVLGVETLILP